MRTRTPIWLSPLFLIIFLMINPTVAKEWKIMPLGNSITWGEHGDPGVQHTDGYRKYLYDMLHDAGIDMYEDKFAGPEQDINPWDYYHADPGEKIEAFLPGGEFNVEPILDIHQPDIVLLHLGTNNHFGGNYPGPSALDYTDNTTPSGKLYELVQKILNKGVEHVLVCKIIPRVDYLGGSWVYDFNGEVERMFFERYAGNDRVIVMDMNQFIKPLNGTDDLGLGLDGVHPTEHGYYMMAQKWMQALKQIDDVDNTAPGKIYWTGGEALDDQSARLAWDAPGDDGNAGRSMLYELRYANYPLNSSNFKNGSLISIPHPGDYGKHESKIVTNLASNTTYYFAIRAYDERGNAGPLSDPMEINIGVGTGNVFAENFGDATLSDWSLNFSQYNIEPEDSTLISRSNGWNNVAVYTKISYSTEASVVKTSLTWANTSRFGDADAAGVAMLLDSDEYNSASGYFVYIRNGFELRLYTVANGVLGSSVSSYKTSAIAQAGDKFQVDWKKSLSGYSFSVKLNGSTIGTLVDTTPNVPMADMLYSGLMTSQYNDISHFSLEIPPLAPEKLTLFAGDNQRGTIEQKLSPLAVKIQDINGVGVENIPVEFAVLQGDAVLTDAQTENFSGNIAVEAESGTLTEPMYISAENDASGKQAIMAPSDATNNVGDAVYNVYVPESGQYYFHVRYYAIDESQNSILLSSESMTTPKTLKFYNYGYETWMWFPSASDNQNSTSMHLNKGFNQITIHNRESGTRIDKFVFSDNPSYHPSGLGPDPTLYDFISDASGIAKTQITLGTVAGPVKVLARTMIENPMTTNADTFIVYAESGEPIDVTVTSNVAIKGIAGQDLPETFALRLYDEYNNACGANTQVRFRIVDGNDGSFYGDPEYIASCENGIASALLTLGWQSETMVEAEIIDHPGFGPYQFKGYTDNVPTDIKLIAGNNQTGEVTEILPDSLKVQILNTIQEPVTNYIVPFEIISGGGIIDSVNTILEVPTDEQGFAAVAYILGDSAAIDYNQVQINVPLNGSPVIFKATSLPKSAKLLVKQHGDRQYANAGQVFQDSLVVRITDEYRNGIANHGVRFTVSNGDGNFEGKTGISTNNADTLIYTDQSGYATVFYAAGTMQGQHQVKAEAEPAISNGFSVFTELYVAAPAPHSIVKLFGDNQTLVVGSAFNDKIKVRILDPFKNNVSFGIPVVFEIKLFGEPAQIDQKYTAQTDENGQAEAILTTPTTAGNHEIWVYLPEQPFVETQKFNLTATPGPAAQIKRINESEFSGRAGEGPIDLAVQVMDQWENPRSNHTVTFQIVRGGYFTNAVQTKPTKSNSSGIASVQYYMGTDVAEINRIKVNSIKWDGSPVQNDGLQFLGTVLPNDPHTLVKISGDQQSGKILTNLPEILTVELVDQYSNPIPEKDLEFTALSPQATVEGNESIVRATNNDGQVAVNIQLGSRSGILNDSLQVRVANNDDIQPIYFSSTATPEVPKRILAIDDSLWENITLGNQPTVLYPIAAVVDSFKNPVPDFKILFRVKHGSSTFGNGTDTLTVKADSLGYASVNWHLSTKPELQQIEAHAVINDIVLDNSPTKFTALTLAGAPRSLYFPKEEYKAIANRPFKEIAVAVVDKWENPIKDYEVKLQVTYPIQGNTGSIIIDGQPVKSVTLITDSTGYIYPEFVPIDGWNMVTVTAQNDFGSALQKSGTAIRIEGQQSQATQVELLTAEHLTLRAGETQLIQMAAYDKEGYFVKGHIINYEILEKQGSLANATPPTPFYSSVSTDDSGIATEQWTVGTQAGTRNSLMINSGIADVPTDTIYTDIMPSYAFEDSCSITITGDVRADSVSFAALTIVLADSFGNRIPGKMVQLVAQEPGVYPEKIEIPTDSDGIVYGAVHSKRAGKIHISAVIEDEPDFELCCTEINVIPGQAVKIKVADGFTSNVVANKGAAVKDSLAVTTLDINDNVSPASWVTFKITNGIGYFAETGEATCRKQSNANGITGAKLVTNNQSATVIVVQASLDNNAKASFIIQVKASPSAPYHLKLADGDSLHAAAGDTLQAPFQVLVTDNENLPINDWPIFFTNSLGTTDGFVGNNPDVTDAFGKAEAYYILPSQSGSYRVRAYSMTNSTESVYFTAFADAGGATQLAHASNLEQYQRVASEVALYVLSQDDNGNNVSGVPVSFSIIDEPEQQINAELTSADEETGTNGLAEARIKLGQKTGTYIVRVASSSSSIEGYIDYTIHGTADIPARLEKVETTDAQYMTFGRELVYPVQVRLLDQYNNPIPHINPADDEDEGKVYFAPKANSGSLLNVSSDNFINTDKNGIASGRWQISNNTVNELYVQAVGTEPNYVVFTAYGTSNHFPKFKPIPQDTTILYGNPFILEINAQDQDNDPLVYSIDNLPAGAVWNSTQKRIEWTPTYTQRGIYTIKMRVQDNKAFPQTGFDVDSIQVQVSSQIRITNPEPQSDMPFIEQPSIQLFSVTVVDYVTPNITYSWFVDSELKMTNESSFQFNSNNYTKGTHQVQVFATDGVGTASFTWNAKITKVELSSFSAQAIPFEGITLNWETSNESNNLGFNVLRAIRSDGPYETMNRDILPSRTDGIYSFIDTLAVTGMRYYYKLEDISTSGVRSQSEYLIANIEIPTEYHLDQNYPNPFNPTTHIQFQLPEPTQVSLIIYNLKGQVVRELVSRKMKAGYYALIWDGKNQQDLAVATGVYYYRLTTPHYKKSMKMLLVK